MVFTTFYTVVNRLASVENYYALLRVQVNTFIYIKSTGTWAVKHRRMLCPQRPKSNVSITRYPKFSEHMAWATDYRFVDNSIATSSSALFSKNPEKVVGCKNMTSSGLYDGQDIWYTVENQVWRPHYQYVVALCFQNLALLRLQWYQNVYFRDQIVTMHCMKNGGLHHCSALYQFVAR